MLGSVARLERGAYIGDVTALCAVPPPPTSDGAVILRRGAKTAELPNGMTVHYVSPPDVQFLYDEIFAESCYLKHGVTLRSTDAVIDVGGNIGMFAMFAARKCTRGKVITLEPIPPTYAALSKVRSI